MKRTRKVTKEERDILMNMRLRSRLSLLVLFYIFGLILPLITCMIITLNFHYFYYIIILLFLLFIIVYLIPKLEKNNYLSDDLKCFETTVVSSSVHDIYYFVCEINGLDDTFIDYKYPVNTKIKKGTEVIVVMTGGRDKYKDYIILDKKTRKVLSDFRTRFDLIEC
ncbi:MAG: hypothetical protein IKN63_02315 [Bacilli bacterium]|nr:hypothetical protein [Bacilli bacterium]